MRVYHIFFFFCYTDQDPRFLKWIRIRPNDTDLSTGKRTWRKNQIESIDRSIKNNNIQTSHGTVIPEVEDRSSSNGRSVAPEIVRMTVEPSPTVRMGAPLLIFLMRSKPPRFLTPPLTKNY